MDQEGEKNNILQLDTNVIHLMQQLGIVFSGPIAVTGGWRCRLDTCSF